MHGLGYREYRQIAVAFMEKHLKYKVDNPFNEEGEDMFNLQAGHLGRTVEMNYARGSKDSRVIGREAMHQYYLISVIWHDFLLKWERKSTMQGIFYSR